MSYRSRYGVTQITGDRMDNLSINRDEFGRGVVPVFLYTPDMKSLDKQGCPHHFHIMLNRRKAKVLHDWLGAYLVDNGRKKP